MPDTVPQEAEIWAKVLSDLGVTDARNAVVVGPAAGRVVAALRRSAGPTAVEVDIAALTTPGAVGGVAPASVDLVILLHAWDGRRTLEPVARRALDWIRVGGTLVLGDLDLDPLVASTPRTYPSALLYRTSPDVTAGLRRRTAPPLELEAAIIRAGTGEKRMATFDWPVAVHQDRSALRSAVASGAWRGTDLLSQEAHAVLLDTVSALSVYAWPLVECEPWYVAAGRVRP
jgi:hypothetical protein